MKKAPTLSQSDPRQLGLSFDLASTEPVQMTIELNPQENTYRKKPAPKVIRPDSFELKDETGRRIMAKVREKLAELARDFRNDARTSKTSGPIFSEVLMTNSHDKKITIAFTRELAGQLVEWFCHQFEDEGMDITAELIDNSIVFLNKREVKEATYDRAVGYK